MTPLSSFAPAVAFAPVTPDYVAPDPLRAMTRIPAVG
jgi:hypothetical protein